MTDLIIIGAGAAALELAEAVVACATHGLPVRLLGFLDDDRSARGFPEHGVAVLGPIEHARLYPQASFLIGVASHRNMGARQHLIGRLGLSAERYLTFVHPDARVSPTAVLGHGVAVMHGVVINLRAHVQDHVLLCQSVILGHDTQVGSGSVVAPAATLSGRVSIGRGVYIGAAAAIAPDLHIGDGAMVGIGAVVIQSVARGTRVFGNPAVDTKG